MAEFFSAAFDLVKGFFAQIFMAFADIRIADILDIVIIAYIIYKAAGFIKETRAKILVKGLVFLFIIWIAAQWFDLITLKWILVKFFDYAIIAVAIIFQPELRHALEKMGHSSFGWFGNNHVNEDNEKIKDSIDSICKACSSMSEERVGALIVFERSTPLGEITATGTDINADVSEELVENLFYPKSPLHDGGVVVRKSKIAAAGCILPLTANNELSKELGTRHRAAVGMSESSDALVVVVSEETGKISVCVNGTIERGFNQVTLKEKLYNEILTAEEDGGQKKLTKLLKIPHKDSKDKQ